MSLNEIRGIEIQNQVILVLEKLKGVKPNNLTAITRNNAEDILRDVSEEALENYNEGFYIPLKEGLSLYLLKNTKSGRIVLLDRNGETIVTSYHDKASRESALLVFLYDLYQGRVEKLEHERKLAKLNKILNCI